MQSSRLQDGSLVITPDGRMSNSGYHKYSKNTWWVRYNGEFLPLNRSSGIIVDGTGGPGGWRGDRSITITIPAAIIAEGGDITIGCGPDEKAGVRETKTFKSLAALQIGQKKTKPPIKKIDKKKQAALESRLASQIDRYAKRIGKLTSKAKRDMARYLLDEIDSSEDAKSSRLRNVKIKKTVSSIGQNLTEAGYDEVAKELTAMAKETQAAREDYYKELGFDIEGADFERLAMLRKKAVNGVYNGKLSLSTDLKKALVKYEGGKLTHDQLVDTIQAGLGTAQARAYTIANTAVQSADRATSFILGEEIGVEFWQYSGVIIENTREFCKRLLTGRHPNTGEPHPNKYTAEEIAKMNNGQGLNVKENCGGYNCTHIWVPDIESVAKAQEKAKEQAPKEAAKAEPVAPVVKTPLDVLAEIKDKEVLSEWAKEHVGLKNDFNTIDLDNKKIIFKRLYELKNEFGHKIAIIEDITTDHIYAQAVGSIHMAFNKKYFTNLEYFEKSLNDSVKSGFHPNGCNTQNSVIDHEYAHLLTSNHIFAKDNFYKKLLNIKNRYTKERNKLDYERDKINAERKDVSVIDTQIKEMVVSRYATKNINEFVAESFAMARHSEKPSKYALEVYEAIKEEYGVK